MNAAGRALSRTLIPSLRVARLEKTDTSLMVTHITCGPQAQDGFCLGQRVVDLNLRLMHGPAAMEAQLEVHMANLQALGNDHLNPPDAGGKIACNSTTYRPPASCTYTHPCVLIERHSLSFPCCFAVGIVVRFRFDLYIPWFPPNPRLK